MPNPDGHFHRKRIEANSPSLPKHNGSRTSRKEHPKLPKRTDVAERNPARFRCPRARSHAHNSFLKDGLAHCFRGGENINDIDLMMLQGHDFRPRSRPSQGYSQSCWRLGSDGSSRQVRLLARSQPYSIRESRELAETSRQRNSAADRLPLAPHSLCTYWLFGVRHL